jgi:hypothetical protein
MCAVQPVTAFSNGVYGDHTSEVEQDYKKIISLRNEIYNGMHCRFKPPRIRSLPPSGKLPPPVTVQTKAQFATIESSKAEGSYQYPILLDNETATTLSPALCVGQDWHSDIAISGRLERAPPHSAEIETFILTMTPSTEPQCSVTSDVRSPPPRRDIIPSSSPAEPNTECGQVDKEHERTAMDKTMTPEKTMAGRTATSVNDQWTPIERRESEECVVPRGNYDKERHGSPNSCYSTIIITSSSPEQSENERHQAVVDRWGSSPTRKITPEKMVPTRTATWTPIERSWSKELCNLPRYYNEERQDSPNHCYSPIIIPSSSIGPPDDENDRADEDRGRSSPAERITRQSVMPTGTTTCTPIKQWRTEQLADPPWNNDSKRQGGRSRCDSPIIPSSNPETPATDRNHTVMEHRRTFSPSEKGGRERERERFLSPRNSPLANIIPRPIPASGWAEQVTTPDIVSDARSRHRYQERPLGRDDKEDRQGRENSIMSERTVSIERSPPPVGSHTTLKTDVPRSGL